MDLFDWLLGNGTVLDGTVIIRIIFLVIVIHLFGIMSYWLRRFN